MEGTAARPVHALSGQPALLATDGDKHGLDPLGTCTPYAPLFPDTFRSLVLFTRPSRPPDTPPSTFVSQHRARLYFASALSFWQFS